MKQYLIIILLLMCSIAYSQNNAGNDSLSLTQAGMLLRKGNPQYSPAKALELYRQVAGNGNAKAMNAIGMMYSFGLGVTADNATALSWFQKAAEAGYAKAWSNIGIMYKNDLGVDQNLTLAYQSFCKGAEQNSPSGLYSQGYMLYKGLGCEQNYAKAVELFKKSIHGDLGSMYMLGLCYRNGYGITQNTDSARYWLNEASQAGYGYATDELSAKEPENISSVTTSSSASKTKSLESGLSNQPDFATYKKVQNSVIANDIDGDYMGYAIKYDWSGKKIIGQSVLTLHLDRTGSQLAGTWVEDDSIQTAVQAMLSDSAVVFDNTGYSRLDHYNRTYPNIFQFKNVRLQMVRNANIVYMAGNLQLYSTKMDEPEKPMYIALTRVQSNNSNLTVKPVDNAYKANSSTELIAYPNPFTNSFQAAFSLEKSSKVGLTLVDLSGKVVQSENVELPAGHQTYTINTELPSGSYLLKLSAEGKTETSLLVKK